MTEKTPAGRRFGVPEGRTERVERMIRKFYPDGTVVDGEPTETGAGGLSLSSLARMFSVYTEPDKTRYTEPDKTRSVAFVRRVVTVADPWTEMDPDESASGAAFQMKRGAELSSDPPFNEMPSPRRDDEVAAWLKRRRDEWADSDGLHEEYPRQWEALDALLDDYREHADTGTPLNQDVARSHDEDADPPAQSRWPIGGEGVRQGEVGVLCPDGQVRDVFSTAMGTGFARVGVASEDLTPGRKVAMIDGQWHQVEEPA